MINSENINLKFINYFIDNSIITRNHFSDKFFIKLRNYPSNVRIGNNILCSIVDFIHRD